jgi:hypothetical protein
MMIPWNEFSDTERMMDINSEDAGYEMKHYDSNCSLEIKTPSSKKLMQMKIKQCIDLHGPYSQCELGSTAFKQLVYKPE